MIPHMAVLILTPERPPLDLPAELNPREPEVLGHPAVPEFPGLPDAGAVGVPRLVLPPELRQHLP